MEAGWKALDFDDFAGNDAFTVIVSFRLTVSFNPQLASSDVVHVEIVADIMSY